MGSLGRRVLTWALKAFLVVTVLSLTMNALTRPPRILAAPRGSDVVVDGAAIHYETWGTRGSPVLLVHGFAESTVSWSLTARELARDHVVVALDLPGYGYSDHTGRYSLSETVQAVAGAVSALELDHPAVVGHSLGAAVVGELARTRPELISGVIFADGDAMPFPGGRSTALSWVLRTPYATSIYRLATGWDWLDERIVRAQCGSACRGFSPELVQEWMRPMRQGVAQQALIDMASQPMLAMTREHAQEITTPRGIIWGSEDATGGGSLAGAQEELGHPRTVVLPKAGHLSMLADPAGFARGVETIMAGWRVTTH